MFALSRILRRKPRWEENRVAARDMLRKILDLVGLLVAILAVHTVAMVLVEGMSLGDALWLTVTSATTVGYGDLSADTLAGRVFTTLLIYIIGIALLAQVAGLWFEYRQERRRRMLTGQWSWVMDKHIVFLNCPADADRRYFEAVLRNIRASAAACSDAPVLLIDEKWPDGLPDVLSELGTVHVALPLTDPRAFANASLAAAETIVVMSHDRADALSDSIAFDLVDQARALNPAAWIIAEVVDDGHRERILRAGANATLRPVRGYPEMMARAILSHRSEHVMETLFNASGEECVRLDWRTSGRWAEIAGRFLEANAGCAIAYEGTDGRVVINPDADHATEAVAVFALVNPRQAPAAERLTGASTAQMARLPGPG